MYSLGLDLSTQSLSALILQQEEASAAAQILGTWSVPFSRFSRKFGLEAGTLCLPPPSPGYYSQPIAMYLEALDQLFALMQAEGAPLSLIAVVNCSSQQHGQVFVNKTFDRACEGLKTPESSIKLTQQFAASFASASAPIWLCSHTGEEAAELEEALGSQRVLSISASAIPLRFSGLVLRHFAKNQQQSYAQTARIHLISSWLAAVLSAQPAAPIDYGNACGTLLMDYQQKKWSKELLSAMGAGLPAGPEGLAQRLPELASPNAVVGQLAPYFCAKYGFSESCSVLVGSGDNPQAKLASPHELLNLGSSFVMMAGAKGPHPWTNAMYDGLGQPFSFACRSNGALVWDEQRKALGLSFEQQEAALERYPLGALEPLNFCPLQESFPLSSEGLVPAATEIPSSYSAEQAITAMIDGTLLEMAATCAQVFAGSEEPLAVTGGVCRSAGVLQRIGQIWQRPIIVLENSGAAYGAALAGLQTLRAPAQ